MSVVVIIANFLDKDRNGLIVTIRATNSLPGALPVYKEKKNPQTVLEHGLGIHSFVQMDL